MQGFDTVIPGLTKIGRIGNHIPDPVISKPIEISGFFLTYPCYFQDDQYMDMFGEPNADMDVYWYAVEPEEEASAEEEHRLGKRSSSFSRILRGSDYPRISRDSSFSRIL